MFKVPNLVLRSLKLNTAFQAYRHCAETVSYYDAKHKTLLMESFDPIQNALHGGRHFVTLLPGAGIGPEIMVHVKDVFKAANAPIDFETINIDPNSEGNDDLECAILSIKRNGVAIKGNIETKSESMDTVSRNVAIRNELDLYISVLNCKSYPGIRSRHKDIDIVIIRQNTEGEYSMLEHKSDHGIVESMKIITKFNSERVARYAFEFARKNRRKKVTTIHKANIMKLSDGLFLETTKRIARDYPEIEHNDMIIDNCCMQLVSKPHQFDVMVMPNLYGTIVSNVVCGLVGGPGLFSSKNYGDHYAIFEPGTRNTGTELSGKNIANPIAMLNSGVDLLEHLGHMYHAKLIKKAIFKTICEDQIHTQDLGGNATTTDVVERVKLHIGHLMKDGSFRSKYYNLNQNVEINDQEKAV